MSTETNFVVDGFSFTQRGETKEMHMASSFINAIINDQIYPIAAKENATLTKHFAEMERLEDEMTRTESKFHPYESPTVASGIHSHLLLLISGIVLIILLSSFSGYVAYRVRSKPTQYAPPMEQTSNHQMEERGNTLSIRRTETHD